MKNVLIIISLILSLQAQEIYTTFKVKAYESADLAFDASGIINKVHVEISKKVKKGEVLAELNNEDVKASLAIAAAQVSNAEVTLAFAQRDYDRQSKVKHLIDEARFDVYVLALEKAKAGLSQAKAQHAYQQALLNKTKLRAPFDGVIFYKAVEVGDVVNGMMLRTVFKVQSNHKRKLIVSFDQKYWKQVELGQKYLYKVDGDTRLYEGRISKIHPSTNTENRKIQVEVKASDFVVGLIGDGHIIINEKE